jgi:arylsulfatase A-like enzyme
MNFRPPSLRSILAILTLATTLVPVIQAAVSPTRPPNIVFILADDLGWNQVGYHGFNWYETPHINRIAREGMQFSQAYSAAAICSPTRAALMTGKAPARLGLTDYIPGNPHLDRPLVTPRQIPCLPLEEETIAELLKRRGYVTGHFGKWHLGLDYKYEPNRPFDPASQGFDVVFTATKPEADLDPVPPDAQSADAITARAIDFIRAHRDQPFFCYVPHNVVHRPLYEEEELVAKYRAKEGATRPDRNPVMGAMIERMDRGIGRILATLEELALLENTIVVFYSDNGGLEALQSQAPLRGGKSMLYEGGIRVPLAVRWPGRIPAGTVNHAPVITMDLFATLADWAGLSDEVVALDGVSLRPLLEGQRDALESRELFWHYPHYHHFGGRPASAIRHKNYKLIEWYEGRLLGMGPAVELFDLAADPGETIDVAARHPALVAQLTERLEAWRKSMGAMKMTIRAN